eukprot:500029-Amphidinium_carterae.1
MCSPGPLEEDGATIQSVTIVPTPSEFLAPFRISLQRLRLSTEQGKTSTRATSTSTGFPGGGKKEMFRGTNFHPGRPVSQMDQH